MNDLTATTTTKPSCLLKNQFEPINIFVCRVVLTKNNFIRPNGNYTTPISTTKTKKLNEIVNSSTRAQVVSWPEDSRASWSTNLMSFAGKENLQYATGRLQQLSNGPKEPNWYFPKIFDSKYLVDDAKVPDIHGQVAITP